ncbi:MAG: 4Fe-4S dicluster domain-containing protein [Myxococcales bacterium]|nr:4Fe-4S dicluster domain-containing protein [Myxococcales bacterium]
MAQVKIEERGCRGCTMCVDLCPVSVFEAQEEVHKAAVVRPEDCIGCLSCFYVCPSQAVSVTDIEVLRPFHRIEKHAALAEKLLGAATAASTLGPAACAEAELDVAGRLHALAAAVMDVFGTGFASIGRRAGTLAATHLPEIHGEDSLEAVLARMQRDFAHSFTFDHRVEGPRVALRFHPCALCKVVEDKGEKVGDAVLCKLFHEYWAGLVGAFVGRSFSYKVPQAGKECLVELELRGA